MNVLVIEGFLEGPLHSRKLKSHLIANGYTIVDSFRAADIIIAHSSAWVYIPPDFANKRILLLDPAYRTEESLLARSVKRGLFDLQHFRFHMPVERFWNLWYLITMLPKWLNLRRKMAVASILPLLTSPRTLVIGVTDNTWWHDTTINESKAHYLHVGGDHDIFWVQPEPILDILDIDY